MHPDPGRQSAAGRGDEDGSAFGTEDGSSTSKIPTQSDLHNLMEEAPLAVSAAPQVNVSLDKTLDALTGVVDSMCHQSNWFT